MLAIVLTILSAHSGSMCTLCGWRQERCYTLAMYNYLHLTEIEQPLGCLITRTEMYNCYVLDTIYTEYSDTGMMYLHQVIVTNVSRVY